MTENERTFANMRRMPLLVAREKLNEYWEAISIIYGQQETINGKTRFHLPCHTFQKLLMFSGKMIELDLPRFFNGWLFCWFVHPSWLEKDYGIKWDWNHGDECEMCAFQKTCYQMKNESDVDE